MTKTGLWCEIVEGEQPRFCGSAGWASAFITAIAVGLMALAGCDLGGTYHKRMQVTAQEVGRKAVFTTLLHASETPVMDEAGKPTGVTFRLPASLDDKSKALPVTEPRAQPPMVKLPGLSYCVERLMDDNAGKFAPLYCYVAAVAKGDQKVDAFETQLQQQVAGAFATAKWQAVSVPTPQGSALPLKLLRVEGPQDFDLAQMQAPMEKLDGRLDLYLFETPAHFVLIGFRGPKAQAAKYQFFEAAQASAGTLKAAPAAATPPAGNAPAPVPPT